MSGIPTLLSPHSPLGWLSFVFSAVKQAESAGRREGKGGEHTSSCLHVFAVFAANELKNYDSIRRRGARSQGAFEGRCIEARIVGLKLLPFFALALPVPLLILEEMPPFCADYALMNSAQGAEPQPEPDTLGAAVAA